MTYLKCVAEFDDQRGIVRECNRERGQVLAKGVEEGDLYMHACDPMKRDAL